jgi:hypothetical protein
MKNTYLNFKTYRIYLLSIIFIFSLNSNLVAQFLSHVPSTSFETTFNIGYGKSRGTAFFIEEKQKKYLVSAKHLFENVLSGSQIKIWILSNQKIQNLDCKIYFHEKSFVDVAVLVPLTTITFDVELMTIESLGMGIGQQMYFLGFPYNNSTIPANKNFSSFPIPLVKVAFLSGTQTIDGITTLLLDGHNNPGFSGGPVIGKNCCNINDNKTYLFGVVVGYVKQNNYLIDKRDSSKLEYIENSGLFIAYSTKSILDIIKTINN